MSESTRSARWVTTVDDIDLLTQVHDRVLEAIASGADIGAAFDGLLPAEEKAVIDIPRNYREPEPMVMPSFVIHNHMPAIEVGPTFVEPPNVDIQNIVEPTPITVEGATVINEVQPTPVSVAAPTVNVTNDVQPSDITIVKEEHKADDDGVPVMTYIVNWPEPKAVKVERDQAGRVTGARQVE